MTDNTAKITGEDLRSILDEFDAQIEQDMQEICSFAEASDTESEAEAELDFETDEISEDDYVEDEAEVEIDAEVEIEAETMSEAEVEVETEHESESEEDIEDEADYEVDEDAEYKKYLFEENIRIKEVERHLEEEKERLEAYEKELDKKAQEVESMSDKFSRERAQFRDEMNVLTGQVTRERQRLKKDEQFFDQKMDILKAGFADLDKAKKELEAERARSQAQASKYYVDDDGPAYNNPIVRTLFSGITNPLMLKKRYKDLVKIYHPDNLAGDHNLFKAITIEYERLQNQIGNEGIG